MINIFARVQILSEILEVPWTDIRKVAIKAKEDAEREKWIRNFFKRPTISKKDGLNGPMSDSVVRDSRHADIVFEACAWIAKKKRKPFSSKGRLDAPLFEFLEFCNLKTDDLLTYLSEGEKEIFGYLKKKQLSKEELLPDHAILSDEVVQNQYSKRFGKYYLIRRVSKPIDNKVLAVETIEIVFDGSIHIIYTDHRGHLHRGLAFFSRDRIVALAFSEKSKKWNYTIRL